MSDLVTRRAFLATAGTFAAAPAIARLDLRSEPSGPVYGRTGPSGIPAGTPRRPSRGTVAMLDGRTLEAFHVTGWRIGPGKGVILTPEAGGGWSVLYAES